MKRVKFWLGSLVCLAALWLALPVLLLAQGEISLEGLAEQLQTLTDRVDVIEALWINSEPLVMADGSCIIGYEGGPHDATVLKFKSAFDEWPNTDNIRVFAVAVDPETGVVSLQYETLYDNQFVIEMWQDCEFLGTTDWWEGRYDDDPFQLPLEELE